MIREIDVKMYISELKEIEGSVRVKSHEMLNAIKAGAKLNSEILNSEEEISPAKKESIINNLRANSEISTKQFIDSIIERVDDISILDSIELANENITPGYYQQLKHLKHQVLLTRKTIDGYNLPELAKHIETTLSCIESSTSIKYSYNPTKAPKHSDKTRQYTVTKPARYVPFPMK